MTNIKNKTYTIPQHHSSNKQDYNVINQLGPRRRQQLINRRRPVTYFGPDQVKILSKNRLIYATSRL